MWVFLQVLSRRNEWRGKARDGRQGRGELNWEEVPRNDRFKAQVDSLCDLHPPAKEAARSYIEDQIGGMGLGASGGNHCTWSHLGIKQGSLGMTWSQNQSRSVREWELWGQWEQWGWWPLENNRLRRSQERVPRREVKSPEWPIDSEATVSPNWKKKEKEED